MEKNLEFIEKKEGIINDNNPELLDLIKENLKISQEILDLTKYIKKYVFWQKIFSWLKFFLILVPLIFAIIYLPPFLENISYSFQEFVDLFNIISNPGSIQGTLLP